MIAGPERHPNSGPPSLHFVRWHDKAMDAPLDMIQKWAEKYYVPQNPSMRISSDEPHSK